MWRRRSPEGPCSGVEVKGKGGSGGDGAAAIDSFVAAIDSFAAVIDSFAAVIDSFAAVIDSFVAVTDSFAGRSVGRTRRSCSCVDRGAREEEGVEGVGSDGRPATLSGCGLERGVASVSCLGA